MDPVFANDYCCIHFVLVLQFVFSFMHVSPYLLYICADCTNVLKSTFNKLGAFLSTG